MKNASDSLRTLRFMLAGMLVLGAVGTAVELLLLEHTEDVWQLVPVILLPAGVIALVFLRYLPGRATLQTTRAVMVSYVISGFVGVYLHYKGNAEFEREMYPSIAGFDLLWESLKGATPTLAPGTMTLIGFLGLTYCWVLGQPGSPAAHDGSSTDH